MKYLETAAIMLGDLNSDVSLLNIDLINKLHTVAGLTIAAGGILYSRQLIALIIHQWIVDNPTKKPYGE